MTKTDVAKYIEDRICGSWNLEISMIEEILTLAEEAGMAPPERENAWHDGRMRKRGWEEVQEKLEK